jgi:uncharacterized protein
MDSISAATLLLGLMAVAVGFFIGAVGVGGILLIPFLTLLGGLSIHQATATALISFLFAGLAGAFLFQRRGTMDWTLTIPMCAGAVVFSYLGALVNSKVEARMLTLIVGALVLLAGVYLLLPPRQRAQGQRDGSHRALLILVGAVAGFGSGLSGAGGPLFSVPMMLLLRFAPLSTIGASQVLQVVAATFGSLGNLQYGSINFATAGWITLCELAGIGFGARAAHAVSVATLRRIAGGLCIAAGLCMAARPVLVEAAGIEPASASPRQSGLHA